MRATVRLFRFLKPYWVWSVLAPLMMLLEVTFDLLQPRLVQRMIDAGVASGSMIVVLSTGVLQFGAALCGWLAGVACGVFAILAGQSQGADLRAALFRKTQALSFGNLDRLETGALVTRLTSDVTQVVELTMTLMRVMVRVPALMIGGFVMALLTSPRLSLIFAVLTPFVLVVQVLVIRRTFPLFGEVQRRLDALNIVLQENLAGVRVVKAFARMRHEIGRFGRANDALMTRNIGAVRASAFAMPLMLFVLNAAVVAALWLGGQRINVGGMRAGELVAFINYLGMSLNALIQISMLVVRVARAAASSERIVAVLDETPDLPAHGAQTPTPAGRLAFENVTFSYRGDEHAPVLSDMSFVAEPGQTVAILGATGSGKSSLVNLIPRFYDATHGRVTLDGVDVRAWDEAALRRAVGIALQETVLFSGSIRDNIRYARADATQDDVETAARLAQAHDFIQSFPEGYDTHVGQRGVNLSGGQKQRIAIARVLLAQPSVLILDDSTSAVDVNTEARIQSALAARPARQTRVLVAQRVSAVRSADQILVLDQGRIVARGGHEDLLRTSPIYREICDSQMSGANGASIHG
jgi:ATP-binding cassette subfamily B protein